MVSNSAFIVDLGPGDSQACPVLPAIWTAAGGSVYLILRKMPEDLEGVAIVLTSPGADAAVRVGLDRSGEGWIEAYLLGQQGLGSYEVVGQRDGRDVWLGRGDVNVIASAAFGDAVVPMEPVQRELNAGYFPVEKDPDGAVLYRRLTLVTEPETGIPVSDWSALLYRFNRLTGKYEEVRDA